MFKQILVFFLALTIAFGFSNEVNTTCDTCGAPTYVDIGTWCSKYSGWSQGCCKCIAEKGSGGNAHACNKKDDGSIAVGLWQINSKDWGLCYSGNTPCNTLSNFACAKLMFAMGENTWKNWDTCEACGCCTKA